MMGDLVLLEDEVNPVMFALLNSRLEVTVIHNHFFWEEPRIFYPSLNPRETRSSLFKHTICISGRCPSSSPVSDSIRIPIAGLGMIAHDK